MARKPASVSESTKKLATATKRMATAKRPTTRQRRSPYELVQELKTKRAELEASYTAKLAKLDEKIQQLELKHGERIKISQLLESKTAEELAQELETIKRQQSLLRKAMKRSTAS